MSTPISFVQAPFLLGQKGVEVQNLQNILLQFAAQGLITASTQLTTQVNTEMTNAELGSATAQLIRIFINQNNIIPSSDLLVDDTVARAINLQINKASLQTLKNTVSGYISLSNVSYDPTVTLYQAFLRNKVAIATAPIDANGFYFISYDAALLNTTASKNVALQVAVHSGTGDLQKEYPSDILYNATGNDQISIGDAENNTTYIEYTEIYNAIAAIAGNIALTDIVLTDDANEVAHLAQQTGETEDRIAQFVTAQKIAHQLNNIVNPDIIYGLIRQNISVAFQSLIGQPDDVLKQNLAIAVVNNIISGYVETQFSAIIATLKSALLRFLVSDSTGDVASSTTHEVIKYVFEGNEDATQNFLNAYYAYPENSEVPFWDYIAAYPAFSGMVDQLKNAISLIALTGNNPALIISLLAQTKPAKMRMMVGGATTSVSLASFASLSKTDWVNTITAAQTSNSALFAIPAGITGSTNTERIANYADVLLGNFGTTYPTQSVATQITAATSTPFQNLKGGLNTFIDQNSNFDIRTASILDLSDASNTTYNFSGISDRSAFVEEVGIVQRLMNVTQDTNTITAMAQNGLHSSVQIAQTSRQVFVDQYASVAGSVANANAIYSKAQSVATYNMAAAIDKYFQLNGKNFYALGDLSTASSGAYAEWRTLFGPLDSCNCSQCTSVYSPSAYMTDMLRFISNTMSGNIHDTLVNVRRPDIKDIELSCKNTNTSVPQIDMVNEMLEDLVSTGQYKMYARQTVADANYQRAIPEYINTSGMDFGTAHVASPYPKLKAAKYPQALPYNFYKRQIDTHLGIAGIKGHELIQRFGTFNKLDAFANQNYCFAYLGLSNEAVDIITTAPATTGNLSDLMEAYGFKAQSGTAPRPIPDPAARGTYISYTGTTWQNVLAGRIDVFLQQTGLQYTELLQLLDCYTLNPASYNGNIVTRKMEITINGNATTPDTCDLDKLQIIGVDTKVLAILYRFVRTAKAFGWSFYELDKAMRIFAPENTSASAYIDKDILKTLAQVKRVTELLKCTVEEACTLWTPDLDQLPYRDYTTSEPADIPNQYLRIFCNPLVANLKTPDYPFKEDGTFTSVTQETFTKYLSGVLNMAPAEVDLLANASFGSTHPLQSMDGISDFYKYALMVKKLKISVKDWLSYQQWISNAAFFGAPTPADPTVLSAANPFESPLKTIQFIGFTRLLKDGNCSVKDVEYLLRDNITDTIADSNQTAAFVKTLTGFRAELAKKMYPDYNATKDSGSQQLQAAILPVMDAEQAARLVAILENTTGIFSDDDAILVDETLRFLIPEGGVSALTDPTATGANAYITAITDRRNYVYNCLKSYTEVSILKPAAINFFAKEFKVDQDITQLLLESCISISTTVGGITTQASGYNTLLRPDFIKGTDTIVRWDNNGNAASFDDQFKVILQFHKASLLITKFGLTLNDVQHLWVNKTFPAVPVLAELPVRNNIAVLPNLTTGTYRTMVNLLGWMQVRSFTGTDTSVLFDSLDNLLPGKKQDALDAISAAFKMGADDLSVLIGTTQTTAGAYIDNGCFGTNYPQQFKSPFTYLRIIDSLEMQHLLPASMQTLLLAAQAVAIADSQDTASKIIQIVKAQYDDKQWMDVVKPVNDVLRVERRDAMIAYLLAYPVAGYENKWLTDNDIYETMMVDVEMMPCMPTTRVLLAINTIQLWIERILLGLEAPFALSKDMARQWNTWRKLYRVWEANRKIFLYPENWIEPELRDDKSPFFLELEKYLKQNEVTKENVEDAYATYLERLDEVAHLDIVGIYRDTVQSANTFAAPNADVLHVFGRTKAAPHIYYYRKYAANEWTPWGKMNVQIDSDHVIPVVWRGRLRFYWLNFTKDVIQQTATNMRSQEPFTAPDPVRWKVDLAWTEYKNGNWTAQQIGKQSWYSFSLTEEDPVSYAHLDYYARAYNTYPRDWYLAGSLDRVKKDRLNFYCNIDDEGQLKFNVMENVFRWSYGSVIDYFSKLTTTYRDLNAHPRNLGFVSDDNIKRAVADFKKMSDNDLIANEYSDHFGNYGSFTVKFNGVIASQKNDPPKNIYHDFEDNASLLQHGYQLDGTSYQYIKTGALGYTHFPDDNARLLANVPTWDKPEAGNHLVFPRIVPQFYAQGSNIQIPYFFYKDYKNTFFVEKYYSSLTSIAVSATGGTSVDQLTIRPTLPSSGRANSGFQLGYPGSAWMPTIQTGAALPTSIQLTQYQYRFHNFHHDNVDDFMETFSSGGLDALLDRKYLNGIQDNLKFVDNYQPVSMYVDTANIPDSKVDFSSTGAYSSYCKIR